MLLEITMRSFEPTEVLTASPILPIVTDAPVFPIKVPDVPVVLIVVEPVIDVGPPVNVAPAFPVISPELLIGPVWPIVPIVVIVPPVRPIVTVPEEDPVPILVGPVLVPVLMFTPPEPELMVVVLVVFVLPTRTALAAAPVPMSMV